MSNTKIRNGNIELLRFIFSIIIIFHHATFEKIPCRGGYLCVEFFFILSGYYMAASISEKSQLECKGFEIVAESLSYFVRRVKSIFPYIFISTFIGYFVLFYTYNWTFNWDQAALIISDLLFLQSFGLPVASYTGIIWYLSSMFIGLFILYPIVRKYFEIFSKYFAPMIALFTMGGLIRTFGRLNVPADYVFGWVCTGNLRAIAMISLGVFLYNPVKFMQNNSTPCTTAKKIANTIIAAVLYGAVILFMFKWEDNMGQLDAFIVILGAAALSISLSGNTITAKPLNNRVCTFLGKLSVALFVCHFYWVQNIFNFFSRIEIEASRIEIEITGLVLTFITAVIVMLLSEAIKKIMRKKQSKSAIKTQS